MGKTNKKKNIGSRRDIIHTVISASVIIAVIGIALYQTIPDLNNPNSLNVADRLEIIAPTQSAFNKEALVRIHAVNATGYTDTTRNDIVKLSLSGPGIAELNATQVTLKEGKATVKIFGEQGRVIVTATWISGESPLKHAEAEIKFSARFLA
ncbi:MAG: hypothetical protein NWF08_05940 [Candidatus Bathyarchaeota archaeon]|nr:hypothetical protein [Candidatus Bathyarchaeota archaeon]